MPHEWTQSRRAFPGSEISPSEHVAWKADEAGLWMDGGLLGFPEAGREILRLSGFKNTLEKVALAAGCLPTQFSDAYGHVLERVESLVARVRELEGALETRVREIAEGIVAAQEKGRGGAVAFDLAGSLRARIAELEAEVRDLRNYIGDKSEILCLGCGESRFLTRDAHPLMAEPCEGCKRASALESQLAEINGWKNDCERGRMRLAAENAALREWKGRAIAALGPLAEPFLKGAAADSREPLKSCGWCADCCGLFGGGTTCQNCGGSTVQVDNSAPFPQTLPCNTGPPEGQPAELA